jgi:hypothetical protein
MHITHQTQPENEWVYPTPSNAKVNCYFAQPNSEYPIWFGFWFCLNSTQSGSCTPLLTCMNKWFRTSITYKWIIMKLMSFNPCPHALILWWNVINFFWIG